MKTVTNEENVLEIKNSKFYSYLYSVSDPMEVKKYLDNVKSMHPKATHYTYAYRIYDMEKSSDDREPKNTAGKPMLGVLQKQDLTNTLVIVVRYFGGIKLGVGPLTRAYVKSVLEVLNKTTYIDLIPGYKIELVLDYNLEKEINKILNSSNIISKEFKEKITYQALVTEEVLNQLRNNNYNFDIINELYIKR